MILQYFNLAGKVAVISGCNTGLGQGMALALAQAGCDIVGLNRSAADETAAMIEAAGRRFTNLRTDLMTANAAEIGELAQKARAVYGHIDILVNNAGIIRREDAIDFSEQNWNEVMNINLNAVFFLSQAVAKIFIAQGDGGKIVNIGSMLSFQGGIRVPSYTASKSAIRGLTMALANEWSQHGINVNAIAPGYFATNNTTQLRTDADRNDAILERIPSGRWGQPDDLGGAIVFLCSRAADYVTGQTLAVDGGWLAR